MNKKLEEYALLVSKIKGLERERDEMKKEILSEMEETDTLRCGIDLGTFTRAARVTYKYSDRVDELQDRIDLLKVREQNDGIAKEKSTTYLLFKPTQM